MNLDLFQAPPTSSAEFSPCGRFRYRLTRTWDAAAPALLFVMLNPSTADASDDDPTIRRCIGFGRRERAGGLVVVNLFAFRATDPKALENAPDPIGPDNARWVETCAAEASGPIIAAWGASVPRRHEDAVGQKILPLLPANRLRCLGRTASGAPRHPLYLLATAALEPWPGPRSPYPHNAE